MRTPTVKTPTSTPTSTPTYPRMHENGRWAEARPNAFVSAGGRADDQTRFQIAQPGEPGAFRVADVHMKVDRDRSIAENLASLKDPDRGLGGRVVDAFDVARHATMKVLGR